MHNTPSTILHCTSLPSLSKGYEFYLSILPSQQAHSLSNGCLRSITILSRSSTNQPKCRNRFKNSWQEHHPKSSEVKETMERHTGAPYLHHYQHHQDQRLVPTEDQTTTTASKELMEKLGKLVDRLGQEEKQQLAQRLNPLNARDPKTDDE